MGKAKIVFIISSYNEVVLISNKTARRKRRQIVINFGEWNNGWSCELWAGEHNAVIFHNHCIDSCFTFGIPCRPTNTFKYIAEILKNEKLSFVMEGAHMQRACDGLNSCRRELSEVHEHLEPLKKNEKFSLSFEHIELPLSLNFFLLTYHFISIESWQ